MLQLFFLNLGLKIMEINRMFVFLIICLAGLPLVAFASDITDSEDHPMITRYPGSSIITYVAVDFDEYVLPLSAPSDKTGVQFDKSKELEGKLTRIGYKMANTTSTLKIYRNFTNAFKKAGFKELFACKKEACGKGGKWQSFFVNNQVWGDNSTARMVTVSKKIKGRDVYIVLYVGDQSNRMTIGLDVIEIQDMENDLIEINAQSLQQKLENEGRVSLYGIKFEVGKAQLLDSSKKAIKDLADVMKKVSTLRVYVVGHTDDTGESKDNLLLSNERAIAVVKQLISQHKIAKERLLAFGAGPYVPVGNNANEEGKALNRRVDIVKRL